MLRSLNVKNKMQIAMQLFPLCLERALKRPRSRCVSAFEFTHSARGQSGGDINCMQTRVSSQAALICMRTGDARTNISICASIRRPAAFVFQHLLALRVWPRSFLHKHTHSQGCLALSHVTWPATDQRPIITPVYARCLPEVLAPWRVHRER